jgi:hypothetical protein
MSRRPRRSCSPDSDRREVEEKRTAESHKVEGSSGADGAERGAGGAVPGAVGVCETGRRQSHARRGQLGSVGSGQERKLGRPGRLRQWRRDVEHTHVAQHLLGSAATRHQRDDATLTTAGALEDVAAPGSGEQGGPVDARALGLRLRGEWRSALLLTGTSARPGSRGRGGERRRDREAELIHETCEWAALYS